MPEDMESDLLCLAEGRDTSGCASRTIMDGMGCEGGVLAAALAKERMGKAGRRTRLSIASSSVWSSGGVAEGSLSSFSGHPPR